MLPTPQCVCAVHVQLKVSWQAGWLAGWLAGRLVGWLEQFSINFN